MMKFLVIVCFLASLVNCDELGWSRFGKSVKTNSQIKEWQNEFPHLVPRDKGIRRESRIIRGEEAERFAYEFQVGIIVHYNGDSNGFCGGSLISNEYVLTAANCFKKGTQATVLLNVTDIENDSPILISSAVVKVHEDFGSYSFENDIALVKLSRKVEFGLGVQPIRLPRLSDAHTSFENYRTKTFGWGKPYSGFNGHIPINHLKSLEASVMSNTVCRLAFPAYVNDKNICTNVEIGTPCDGDEGGPLVIKEPDGEFTQLGLFSFQLQILCDSGWPAVFTRVSKFLNWIEANSGVVPRL